MPAVAITGATGAVGGRVVRALEKWGVEQRLIVRDRGRAPRLARAEIAEVAGGYGDGEGMKAALAGIRTMFMVSADDGADRVEQHLTMVAAAAAAGVERVVYTSFLGAAPDSMFSLARDHWRTEQAIREAGLAFTFLADSIYLDFIPLFAGADGAIRGPAGAGRLAPVSRDDVAAVAANVLVAEGEHDGRTLDLTGPELFGLEEAAARLTAYAGRKFSYIDEALEEAWSSRRPSPDHSPR